MSAHPWRIDPGLASDLAEAIGWSPTDGAGALTGRLPERVPAGSTAKLAAVARGEVPPGADGDGLARVVLDHQRAWDRRPDGGAPSPSWSCWVFTTLMASLVDWADLGPVRVAGVRRIDERAPVVDYHAAVVVGDGAEPLICDPYFGTSVALPPEPGRANLVETTIATATAERGPDGAWFLESHLAHWEHGCRYRLLAPALDRGDVHAFCAVSVTHSGVPSKPYARLHVDGRVVDAVARAEAGVTWEEAAEAFAASTGVRIT